MWLVGCHIRPHSSVTLMVRKKLEFLFATLESTSPSRTAGGSPSHVERSRKGEAQSLNCRREWWCPCAGGTEPSKEELWGVEDG